MTCRVLGILRKVIIIIMAKKKKEIPLVDSHFEIHKINYGRSKCRMNVRAKSTLSFPRGFYIFLVQKPFEL